MKGLRRSCCAGPLPVRTPCAQCPPNMWRELANRGDTDALLLVMTAGDHRKRIQWAPAVVEAAAQAGWALDASGFVAPKRYVDRAQA